METRTLAKGSHAVKLGAAALALAAAVAAQDPAEPPGGKARPKLPPPLAGAIARSAVDPKALEATVSDLVACGTRHSLSSWEDPARGIGCGRDRIVARLSRIAKDSGGKLEVVVDRFEATSQRTHDRPARFENVYGILPVSYTHLTLPTILRV